MSTTTTQLLLVGAVVIVVVAVVAALSWRRRTPMRGLEAVDLKPGIYLFTSGTCLECGPARDVLDEHLGAEGYREFTWEADPEIFEKIPVDEVPVTIVVPRTGSALLWRGDPSEMFSGSMLE